MNVPRFLRRLFLQPYDGLRHFRVVDDGKLYRCGQPTAEELAGLIDRLGLRTVIALRGSRADSDPDGWELEERRVCREKGVGFVALPCNHKNPPTIAQLNEFIELTKDSRRLPALVHCRIGQQRTGLFCAVYRVFVQGVSPDDALREMDGLGFNSGHRRHQLLLQSFRAATLSLQTPTTAPVAQRA